MSTNEALDQKAAQIVKVFKNAFIVLGIITMLVLFIWGHDFEDYHYEKIATKAMQLECAKSCVLHDVSLSNLVGPKIVGKKESRQYVHYIFSWQSGTSPPMTILREDYSSPVNDDPQITFQWMTL